MDIFISALYILGVLSALIIAHELGHYVAAKICKMNVEDFSLFFGPRLIRLGKWGGTEFNIRSFPLGGYVKVAGMEPDDLIVGSALLRPTLATGKPVTLRGFSEAALEELDRNNLSDRTLVIAEGAVGTDFRLTPEGKAQIQDLITGAGINSDEHKYLEAVIAADAYRPSPNDFNQKPLHQRAFMIAAGPFMSFAFGYLIFCYMGVTIGLPPSHPATPPNIVRAVTPGKPAARAGILAGDRIIEVEGKSIADWPQLVSSILPNPGKPLKVVVDRRGSSFNFVITPDTSDGDVLENGKMVKKKVGRIGIERPNDNLVKLSLLDSMKRGSELVYEQTVGTLMAFGKPKELNEGSGGIIKISEVLHQDRQLGMPVILMRSALLSIGLGIMNLIPIPLLDGGHLLLFAIEGIGRRKLTAKEVFTAYAFGASIILALFVWITLKDVITVIVPLFHKKS